MNLIVAIFCYLGLASSTEVQISDSDIQAHRIEIEQTQNDPGFYEYLEAHTCADGIFVMDTQSCE
jgi:hypothetical protein